MPRSLSISAIMVFSQSRLAALAQIAVKAFTAQTYAHRELIVVNRSEQALGLDLPGVTEIGVRGLTLGAAMNLGVRVARGDWLLRWDADHWSHPERMAYQFAHRADSGCVMLQRQLRVVVRMREEHWFGFARDENAGLTDSLLWPRGAGEFRDVDLWFDSLFLADQFGDDKVVVPNTGEPGAAYQIVFWHGLNQDTQAEFLGESEGGNSTPSPSQVELLKSVLQSYGVPTGQGGWTASGHQGF